TSNHEEKTSVQNGQLSKMNLRFICNKQTSNYYQQKLVPYSYINILEDNQNQTIRNYTLNKLGKHKFDENNFTDDVDARNKKLKHNENLQQGM
ncbi:22396_t:CDS:2, partial [Dentiscutata erythropus]